MRARSGAVVGALTGVAVLAGACAGTEGAEGGAPVVATTSVLADVATHVTCGELEVPSLVPRGTDAHEFEPGVRDADRLGRARLVVANGLGLEDRLADALDRARDDGVEVLEVAPSAEPLPAFGRSDDASDGGDDDHDHGDLDPHVWTDPERMAVVAELLGRELADVPGTGVPAERIRRCAGRYAATLRELVEEVRATLSAVPAEDRRLVTDHEALAYFAQRFGFDVVGAAIPSTSSLGEPNPRDLDELAATVRAAGVPAVFADAAGSTDVADALAERIGDDVRVVELHTESLGPEGSPTGTYVGMVRANARLVADALAGGRG